jgi:predicted O-linked N-acetylglucosamine transferase (SPINDLY family)
LKNAVGSRAFKNARARKQHDKDAGQILAQALGFHRSGAQAEAQALCRLILQHRPDDFDALHLLGVASSAAGQFEDAEAALRHALRVAPRSAQAHCNLGVVQFERKQFDDARASYENALALQPNFPVALNNLGNAYNSLSLLDQAVESYRRAIAYQPDYAEAVYNCGIALFLLRRHAEALTSFDRCLTLAPGHVLALNARGLALLALRRATDALASFDRALALKPDLANALANRGQALGELGRYDQAIQSHETALTITPDLETAWMGLAGIFLLAGRLDNAFTAARRALAIVPESAEAITLMGQCLFNLGNVEDAISHFDRALAIKPDSEDAMTKKIFALDFAPDAGFARHQDARKEWWRQIGSKHAGVPAVHRSDRDPQRRIVLGYVSSDFRDHSAALCFISVLRHHDKRAFEVVCYSCGTIEDGVTEEFRRIADKWIGASALSDDDLARQICADNIDILIDLSGHSTGHRLGVFARKPAPIQVTAWGNGTGTGLPTIDYLFSDATAIPGDVRHLFAEKIYDLPCLATIAPLPAELSVAEPPYLTSGYITFGVFNRINKISADAAKLWCEILHAVPNSRLMIKHSALDDVMLASRLIEQFTQHGISADRIECVGSTTRRDHLAAYGRVDICLDPFPQNGGISTWESLYMGVPVVAKLGDSLSSRVAGAILSSLGLTDWIGGSDVDYRDIAVKYASTPALLDPLRRALPSQITATPAGDPVQYTNAVEAAYRGFWTRYCAKGASSI